ncbi:MAG: phenylalanine--tRNA ligase subunit beta [Bacteroidales bacterium]|nr:phenylalanine--tRNA ligase subunit beta [Bacteroidales bacterium]
MNISYNWLKQYINLTISADAVAELLTKIGLEVDSVSEVQSIKGGLKGLVVGEVLTCVPHPNSDHMHVTTVDVGAGEPLDIVCGAPNVAAGQKVIIATIGTVLYDGDQEFKIKPAKLRGVPSNGMICAEDEIGIGTSHDGIIVLPADVKVGTPAAEYYNIENDTLIEVDITPNRVDAASHYGVARDLAAALGITDKPATLSRPSVDDFKTDNKSYEVKVSVENQNACMRYCGVTISGVKIAPSPEWLQKRLKAIGLNPINNVVDVTNYILMAVGQPLHAFDGDKIKGNEIHVRTGLGGKKFTTLDGKERELHNDDLLICNAEEPMCLAGVFGGLDSGVSDSTTKIFLESAWFNPVNIRKTARRQQLSTDASFRYERGTDPNITIYALKRAAMLIKEVAGGEISSDIVDIYPNPVAPFEVEVSRKRMFSLIGREIEETVLKQILKGLEMEIKSDDGDKMTLLVPRYRVDVTREADVVEDVLRIFGYDNVEVPSDVHSTIVYAPKPDPTHVLNVIGAQLSSEGFNEIMCNTLTRGAYYNGLTTYPSEANIELVNPLSSDLNTLRQTLLFGALESVRLNRNHRNANLRLFEIGNCHSFKGGDKTVLDNYKSEQRLMLLMTGLSEEPNWNTPARQSSFYDLKTSVLNIIRRLGIRFDSIEELPLQSDIFSDGITLTIDKSKSLGEFGVVNSNILKQFDIDTPVYYAELHMPVIMDKCAKHNKILFSELPKYPEVRRDLSMLIDKTVTFAQIRSLAQRTEKKLLKGVSLFDVYEGKNLPAGKKSYAVSFILRDAEKTLNDKQIEKVMEQLINVMKKELGAELR